MLCNSPPLEAFLFKPYEVKAFRSDAKHRQKRNKIPGGVYMCWEINSTSGTTWNAIVPCCTPCGRFKSEKGLTPHLSRKLKSNRYAVRAYRCGTFWQDSEIRKKNVVPPAGIYKPIVASE
jgi:hypothetical protein